MSENKSPIPSRLYNAAKGGHVAGTADIIDDDKGKTQDVINQETDSALENRYTKEETYSKTELNSLITTPSQKYVSVTATDQTTDVTDVLPATGEADTIYRVGNWDGTQYSEVDYTEYAWNGSAYVKLDTKSQIGEVYDISANHADTKYADLAAALGTNGANIPQSLRKGGMSVKFVHTSDNNYVQFRCISNEFTTDTNYWIKQSLIEDKNSNTSPLNIRDDKGHIIVEFDGDIKTKNFDSKKTPALLPESKDLAFKDDNGNVIVYINKGRIKTISFDSDATPNIIECSVNGLRLQDTNDNSIVDFSNGGIKTKFFSSSVNIKNQFRYMHWNVGHWCGGQGTSTTITDAEQKERAIKAYRTLFNKYHADIIGMSEYSDIFANVGGVTSQATKDLLEPYPHYVIGKTGTTGWIKNALFCKRGSILRGINYIDFDRGFYALWTISNIAGRRIVLCELHAPWQTAEENIAAINAVITAFADYPYVIISGDYNTRTDSADDVFAALKNNGYQVANHGYMGEIITHGYADESHNIGLGIDNIAVKGGDIINIASPASVDVELRQMINTGSADGAYVEVTKNNIKIGYNITGEDGYVYSLSDHLPIICDIVF